MCTAVSLTTADHYFGRNLDLDYRYRETVTVMPRNYPLRFRCGKEIAEHYAIIGISTNDQGYPLYYDAVNEWGLSIAGLNFPAEAQYLPRASHADNIAPFECIPWILSQCRNVSQACGLLHKINLWALPYSREYPITPLHWIIADRSECLVVEPSEHGLEIRKNPIGILTNSPAFPYHMSNLSNYCNLTAGQPQNRFAVSLDLSPTSLGLGAFGLPGDLSSPSRFIRAAFIKCNSICSQDELSSVTQFFHILDGVKQINGCCKTRNGLEKTVYSSCCNTRRGIYYWTTYDNRQIRAVDMHLENLNGQKIIPYDIYAPQEISVIN